VYFSALFSALGEGAFSASRPGHFIPRKRDHNIYYTRDVTDSVIVPDPSAFGNPIPMSRSPSP